MNREEAIKYFKNILEQSAFWHDGEEEWLAIDALESAKDNNVPVKQPDTRVILEWIKTTDRLPTKEDAGIDGFVAFCYRDEWDCFNRLEKWDEISPQKHTYWHRMLKAPEVEE